MQQLYTSDLTASQWQGIEKFILSKRKSIWPLQRIVDAIFYVTKNGIVWRDLPKGFPAWQTVYWYFRKWAKDDTWLLLANELTMLHRLKVDKKPLPTVAIIDAQSVKNSSTATEQIGFDGGKLIKGRKRFLIVDTMAGPPVRAFVVDPCAPGPCSGWQSRGVALGASQASQPVAVRSGTNLC